MLYPQIEFVYPTETNKYGLPSGNLGLFPLILDPGYSIVISTNQLILDPYHLPQDLSMRGWISEQKGGIGVVYLPDTLNHWTLTSLQKRVIEIYDVNTRVPSQPSSIALQPGNYWLNILNLINITNYFAVDMAIS